MKLVRPTIFYTKKYINILDLGRKLIITHNTTWIISGNITCRIYKTIILPVVLYGCKT